MVDPLVMVPGQQIFLNNPIVNWTAVPSDTNPPSVVLTASVQVDPSQLAVPNPDAMATTLAVQMDAQVAMLLYEELGDLGRKMGWLLQ